MASDVYRATGYDRKAGVQAMQRLVPEKYKMRLSAADVTLGEVLKSEYLPPDSVLLKEPGLYCREYIWRVLVHSRTHAYEIARATDNFFGAVKSIDEKRVFRGYLRYSRRVEIARATENFPARLGIARATENFPRATKNCPRERMTSSKKSC